MLKDIRAIFKTEKKYRAFLKSGKISEEQFMAQRKAEALTLFETFHTHLVEVSKTVIPKSTFDVAVSYALGQWDILTIISSHPCSRQIIRPPSEPSEA